MTNTPKIKRVTGADPPLGLNSLLTRDMIQAPRTSPIISGRIYCTAPAL